eukprot:TRINITY_DN9731_c0_g1_i2.p1 TRINITY_DN9731_c0_g1~~TRINITY_DN9731_c0_g1_i2.p1  ORF type:complete len:482 (-),score=53.04 TRINITY_DN9731_c0_g1_i2:7-1452(-)
MISTHVLVLSIFALILLVIGFMYSKQRRFAMKTKTKGVGVLFLLNNLSSLETGFHKFAKDTKSQDFVHMSVGSENALIAISPESAKFVLKTKQGIKKTFGDSTGLSSIKPWFTQNLLGVDTVDWGRHRAYYSPAFNSVAYKSYFSTFDKVVDDCLGVIGGHKEDFDMASIAHRFTLDLLGQAVFHHDFGLLKGQGDEYYEAYSTIMKTMFEDRRYMIAPWLEHLPLPTSKKFKKSIEIMAKLFRRLIDERQQAPVSKDIDILDHFIQARRLDTSGGLTDTELMSNMFILFLAGHDTTASSISWAFYELVRNPHLQEELSQEINKLLHGESPTSIEDLEKLEKLDCFIKENLRMHPPVSLILSRQASEDLEYKDITIPKGTRLFINVHSIHYGESWEEPEKFSLERFSPENTKGRDRFSYLPFSLGTRQCIGNNFSLIEQKLFLSKFIQKYRLSTPLTHILSDKKKGGFNTPLNVWVRVSVK